MKQKEAIYNFLRDKRFGDPAGGWVWAYELNGPRFGISAWRRCREMASTVEKTMRPGNKFYCVLEHREERTSTGKRVGQYRYKLTDSERAYLKERLKQQSIPTTLFSPPSKVEEGSESTINT